MRETPVLVNDDGEVVTQSNAVLWYLAEGTAYLPETALERAQVVQWLSFEQERVMGGIGSARFRALTGRDRLDPKAHAARLATGDGALSALDAHLTGRDWLVGARPTIADVSVYAYTHVAADAGYDLAAYPAVGAWIEGVQALPGFVADLVTYPPNAFPGASRSIYD